MAGRGPILRPERVHHDARAWRRVPFIQHRARATIHRAPVHTRLPSARGGAAAARTTLLRSDGIRNGGQPRCFQREVVCSIRVHAQRLGLPRL